MVDSAALALVLPSLSAHYMVLPVPRCSAGLLPGIPHVPTAQPTEPSLKPKAHTTPPLHPGSLPPCSLTPTIFEFSFPWSGMLSPRVPQAYRAEECSPIHTYQGPRNGT